MRITRKQEKRLIIGSIFTLVVLTVYNINYGPTPDAPLWGKLLFPLLETLAGYFFMRWVTKRYGHEKEPEKRKAH